MKRVRVACVAGMFAAHALTACVADDSAGVATDNPLETNVSYDASPNTVFILQWCGAEPCGGASGFIVDPELPVLVTSTGLELAKRHLQREAGLRVTHYVIYFPSWGKREFSVSANDAPLVVHPSALENIDQLATSDPMMFGGNHDFFNLALLRLPDSPMGMGYQRAVSLRFADAPLDSEDGQLDRVLMLDGAAPTQDAMRAESRAGHLRLALRHHTRYEAFDTAPVHLRAVEEGTLAQVTPGDYGGLVYYSSSHQSDASGCGGGDSVYGVLSGLRGTWLAVLELGYMLNVSDDVLGNPSGAIETDDLRRDARALYNTLERTAPHFMEYATTRLMQERVQRPPPHPLPEGAAALAYQVTRLDHLAQYEGDSIVDWISRGGK